MSQTSSSRLLRWGCVLLPPALLAAGFAWAAGLFSPHRLSTARFMTVLENGGGAAPGFRRAHSKGLCVLGQFDASGAMTAYSSAAVFSQSHIPVTGRLALAPPFPHIVDGPGIVRSMALRLQPDHAQEWRTTMNDPPLQPMRDIQDAFASFSANQRDPVTHKPDPRLAKAYEEARPWLKTAYAANRAHVMSSDFANDTFNSIDSFQVTNAQGERHTVRWSMVPVSPPEAPVRPEDAHDPNVLFTHVIASLHQQPLRWNLVVTIANPSDPVNDPSQPWAPTDRTVTAGTLTLHSSASEDNSPCGGMVFDPTILPSGLSLSGDPLPALRSAVYMRSFVRRSGETKDPSSITPAMTQPH
ncbi:MULTISPECIES: catalase [unclassified Saccharibacter]|uniref:catalase n=1 Tax=unclassified Saccharibacter TaxID=2648722 RepID=UPI001322B0A5|nr:MULTISPECIES: catalase [unclassified Saccharibacter]MXV36904.1 catalase [Saccharibacter sp. EH611]MXV58606.1 catalase [Saccharibacter sp. EH70]MXV66112.1 catalase [Saccharibacter sp. EH60]